MDVCNEKVADSNDDGGGRDVDERHSKVDLSMEEKSDDEAVGLSKELWGRHIYEEQVSCDSEEEVGQDAETSHKLGDDTVKLLVVSPRLEAE